MTPEECVKQPAPVEELPDLDETVEGRLWFWLNTWVLASQRDMARQHLEHILGTKI